MVGPDIICRNIFCGAFGTWPKWHCAQWSRNTAAPGSASTSQEVEARKIFDQLDANHDGTLSFEEFSRATFRAK